MIVLRDGEPDTSSEPSVVAIGVFDGLHRGHQKVLDQLMDVARAAHARTTVVTFDPAPAAVLAPERAPRLLETIDQRLEGFSRLGIDEVRVLTFSKELASESASEFIDRVLVKELRAICVVVGEDFHFGHDREGTLETLREAGRERGFDVIAAPTHGDPTRWSSTAVREALAHGDLARAEAILGRPFALRGVVVHGDERGGELGFPTANLQLDPHQAVPAEGVYAGAVAREGRSWAAAISIGTRPQFYADGALLVEVHVVGFDGDLYGKTLEVTFLARLRDQATFANVEDLIEQMTRDVIEAQQRFDEYAKGQH